MNYTTHLFYIPPAWRYAIFQLYDKGEIHEPLMNTETFHT